MWVHAYRSMVKSSFPDSPPYKVNPEPLTAAQLGPRGYTGRPVIMPGTPGPDDGYTAMVTELRSEVGPYAPAPSSIAPVSSVPENTSASMTDWYPGSGTASQQTQTGSWAPDTRPMINRDWTPYQTS